MTETRNTWWVKVEHILSIWKLVVTVGLVSLEPFQNIFFLNSKIMLMFTVNMFPFLIISKLFIHEFVTLCRRQNYVPSSTTLLNYFSPTAGLCWFKLNERAMEKCTKLICVKNFFCLFNKNENIELEKMWNVYQILLQECCQHFKENRKSKKIHIIYILMQMSCVLCTKPNILKENNISLHPRDFGKLIMKMMKLVFNINIAQ